MSYYQEIISERISPLTKEGELLYKLTRGASEQIYEIAKRHSESKFDTKIVRNAYGDDLTNQANEFFYKLACNYDGAIAQQVTNGRGHWYTRVQINNVIFTISQVKTMGEMVRESVFRNDFVTDLNPTLFNPHPVIISREEPIYAVITHGPVSSKNRNIGFLNVGVIDSGYNSYVYLKDLYKKCSIKRSYETVPAVEPKQQKISKDEPKISIKRSS
jgi:(2Fe-2S) ferredoxin